MSQVPSVSPQSPGPRSLFYHQDSLGSTINLTGPGGAVTEGYLYDAWGNYRELDVDGQFDSSPDLDLSNLYAWETYLTNIQAAFDPTSPEPLTPSPASWNRFTYTGHEFDPETGLYYFKARFYDPELGRFASEDPYLGDPTAPPSLHRYLYAYASPARYVDLTGYLAGEITTRDRSGRPYVIERVEEQDLKKGVVNTVLSNFPFESAEQRQQFEEELIRLNNGKFSRNENGELIFTGKVGTPFRMPVHHEYAMTEEATAEYVQDTGGASNYDEYRQHRLAQGVAGGVKRHVRSIGRMAVKTGKNIAQTAINSYRYMATAPLAIYQDSQAIGEFLGTNSTEYGRQEMVRQFGEEARRLLTTEEGNEDVAAAVLTTFILAKGAPQGPSNTWLKLEASKLPVPPSSGVTANRVAGNAARDFIAEREAPALIEQNLRTTGGLRRLDVLKVGEQIVGIESKIGRTYLTQQVRQELARDIKLIRSGQLDKVRWEFWRSARTGKGGPSAPLRQKLEKLGVEIVENERSF